MLEVLADTSIDENRIAAEVILYADKICVDELSGGAPPCQGGGRGFDPRLALS